MRSNSLKAIRIKSAFFACALLLAGGRALAAQQVNLTAGPVGLTLPDGSTVPMWGYSCGTAVGGSTATCAKLHPSATGWSPVVITVPTGQALTINLTNNLSFGSTPNTIPTSLVIVGQLGGGLGDVTQRTVTAAPDHSNAQQLTWPIADPGTTGTPPTQGPRVQSFSTEVPAGATTALTWAAPRPGTYLIESGTHPSIQGPMGLYGMLVVTTAPATSAGTAYPGVSYNADVPLLFSEIDPVQNNAVDAAVKTTGFSETMVWSGQPGGCGNPSSATYQQCYPPAVDYAPLYFMINGVAFDKTQAPASLFPASPAAGVTGNVLLRLVNAGLRMHVPSIVGALTGSTPVPGVGLIAEDGNPLPGATRVQSEVFLAAGKTYDVMIRVPAAGGSALPVFDRALSLSANAAVRDAGMLGYIGVNGAPLPSAAATDSAYGTCVGGTNPGHTCSMAGTECLGGGSCIPNVVAYPDNYPSVVPGKSLVVSDIAKGVLANDVNVYGVAVQTGSGPAQGTLALNVDGTFTYAPNATWNTTTTTDSFTYCGNGMTSGATCALVTLSKATIEAASGITVNDDTYTSNVATTLSIKPPGVLSNDVDSMGYPLTVDTSSVVTTSGLTVSMDPSGAFQATATGPGPHTFTYKAQNSQGTTSAASATVTLNFPTATGLAVSVVDGNDKTTAITDYRWIIEEDRTFYVNPSATTNTSSGIVPTLGTNFHTSYMPIVATGCTGSLSCESGQTVLGQAAVCDVGNGACRTTGTQQTPLDPSQVHLDPTKRYYISVLPGDGADALAGDAAQGHAHGMGGAPIAAGQTAVTVLTQPTPFPPAKLSVFVFEDDFPLNGEQDASGGAGDTLASNEPGLGGFNITIMDEAGGSGDATGQANYDMFNMPLSNSLAGTIDPTTGQDACPISKQGTNDPAQAGITGSIVTCPKYEADGTTLSPLAGQALIANMYPGRYGVIATPAAERIARGEEWLQTNTLDGQKALDSFLRIGEPSYFQEYGPAGYHVSIGFANPKIINGRLKGVCAGTDPNLSGSNCSHSLTGRVTTERTSRTPDERLYSSGSRDSFSFSQCYVSVGDPDGEDFAFTKCNPDGTFSFSGLPAGNWRVTTFDQWNDQLVDGLSTPVSLTSSSTNMGDIAANQWQANIYTRSFIDTNKDGVSADSEPGLALVPTNIRFRDGSFSNFNNTDLNGFAGFNEVFPLFNWYVVESDTTRYKNTGTHVVYDAGGPADGTTGGGTSTIAANLANTVEQLPLPANLRVPGAVYCANADCTGSSIATGPITGGSSGPTTGLSTGRIDPPWVLTEGWQGFAGQNSFLEFGKTPYVPGETGGIRGHVVYASTRPFDDPQLLLQLSWEPLVPHVTINLYAEGTAPDGSQSLTLVDTTQTSSFDDWAQGFRSDGVPNMNCPGQGRDTGTNADSFFFTLFNQPNWLDVYNNTPHALPNNSQFKCYDGMHNWNQLQPASYDGLYQFPSVTGLNPTTSKPTGTNCHMATPAEPWGCIPNPDTSDPYRSGAPMLQPGKYVVEMVVPPGYELVKEEDKNILIGDTYIAPVTVEFPGLAGAVYILPDQAAVRASYNVNNPQNPTTDLGVKPRHEGDTGSVETFWPCVGQERIVPDYISLFPGSGEVAPFAGATRHLCDRKEVALQDQSAVLAKFYVFTSTHVAAHFTGIITDDYTSEYDPFSPAFGEKFSPPNMPVSIKDWAGNEISRIYSDQWGVYDGLNYSTWEVNPPNPTGYAPQMMITCMNDAGTGTTPDPLFNPGYSQFCYEIPFMPGQTQYMDTPVVPTSAFAGAGYNNPDCAYPDATPAIKEVDGDGTGPWVSAAGTGHTLTITALGDQTVNSNTYSGPSATTAPYNQKTVTRHYGFGSRPSSCPASGPCPNVTVGGVPMTAVTWTDSSITGTVPPGVPACPVQQQAQYGGASAQCGELVITAGNGKQSIDTVTVTIGGKPPTLVAGGATIQSAIDAADPGDLIVVGPGVYDELLLMWKPVRLQGVGAASSIINANTHPAGKLDPWREQIKSLFGLTPDGQPMDPFDPQVDRMPVEGVPAWDVTSNGNLAEMLQEPTLMGAYEGAGITVLAKGVKIPPGAPNPLGSGLGGTFPDGTTLLTPDDCATGAGGSNPYPSNFHCNPSSIDGLSVSNSSQGGGGIFVHGWGHNLQIANNRVTNNSGTLSGGISVGLGEVPGAYLVGATITAPGSCLDSTVTNLQLPYCFNLNVNVHHNAVTYNSSLGDELFASTPAGSGGVTFTTGADYYKFRNNWVCGNMSTGDGGGVTHLGYSWYGDIEHNQILFNESTNPTVSTNGGGLMVMGDPPDGMTPAGVECGTTVDTDCVHGLSDGTGPGLVINANLFMGNAAESGSGGGVRLQGVNGTEVAFFPNGSHFVQRPVLEGGVQPPPGTPVWNTVKVTNNIIANNVAGWDGAGVAMQDALDVDIINNTVASNDTTASAGVLFNTLGAPLASSVSSNCTQSGQPTRSCPGPAGLVSVRNSSQLTASFSGVGTITCPANHPNCKTFSYPYLANDLFWQNRSFYIGVGAFGQGTQSQQHVVSLYNAFTTTQAPSQSMTGACPSASYWDIGARGDTRPNNHSSGITLAPNYSVLTDAGDYSGTHSLGSNPNVVSQYCNGSRVPPELGAMGYRVPPGIADATVPNPVFNLQPAATVDEGNNWINMSWGPLSLVNPVGFTLGNYALSRTSPAIDYVPNTSSTFAIAPSSDFFGNPRPSPSNTHALDVGAVEFTATVALEPTSLTFPSLFLGTTSAPQSVTLLNPLPTTLTGINISTSGDFAVSGTTCGASLGPNGSCTISVTFTPTARGTRIGLLSVAYAGGSRQASLSGTGLAPNAAVMPSSLSFPNTTVNATSAALSVTLSNAAPANTALTIGVAFVGPNSGDFIRTTGANNCGSSLAVGASCNIYVQFRPTATSARSATLNITSNDPVNPLLSIPLSGTGVGPVNAVAPSSLAFGNQQTGTTSAPQPVTVTNNGNANLTINSITVGAQFAQTNNCPLSPSTLAPSASCTINVTFKPTSTGAKTATLSVTVAAPATSGSVSLSGTGVAPSATLTGTAAFGNQQVSTTSAPHTFTYTNTGIGPITVSNTGVTLSGGNSTTDYAISSNTCIVGGVGVTLPPSGTCQIGVTFTPSTTGSRTRTLTVIDTAGGAPNQTASLTGTGQTAPVTTTSTTSTSTATSATTSSTTSTTTPAGATTSTTTSTSTPTTTATTSSTTTTSTPTNTSTTLAVYQAGVSGPAGSADVDTYIRLSQPTTNFNTDAFVIVGLTNASNKVNRGLLAFNLQGIPATAVVTGCTLQVNVTQNTSPTPGHIRRLCAEHWLDGDGQSEAQATWNEWKTGTAWGTAGAASTAACSAGGDYDSTGAVAYTPPTATGLFTFQNLTGLCQDAVTSRSGRLRLLITQDAETTQSNLIKFDSSEATTAANRPKLSVTWHP